MSDTVKDSTPTAVTEDLPSCDNLHFAANQLERAMARDISDPDERAVWARTIRRLRNLALRTPE